MRSEKLPAAFGSREKRAKEYDLLSLTVCQSSGLESLSLGGGCTLGSSASSSFPSSSPIDSAEYWRRRARDVHLAMSSYSTTVFSQSFYLVVVRSCLPMVLTISHGVKGRWWEFFIRIAILTAWSIAYKTAPASMWILLFASPRKKQGVDRVRVMAVNILYAYTLIQQPFRVFYCLSLYKNTYVACEKCRALIKVRPLHQRVQTAVKHDYYYYFCHYYNLFTLMFLYVLVASITFK